MKASFQRTRRFILLGCGWVAGIGCARHPPSEDDLAKKDAGSASAPVASADAASSATAPPLPGLPRTNYRGIWGSGPDDIWAVGDKGTIAHFDGHAWSPS